jgi:phospholipid/cholesterol/gamma-HCH transport system substrate-binding protein
MKKSRNQSLSELKLGLTVIAAIAVLALGIMNMGGDGQLFASHYTLFMRMENTYGLKIGGPVRLAGFSVGSIEEITFPDDINDKRVVVRLNIEKKYQDRIREDSDVAINSMGLLGDKYVEMGIGSEASPVLQDGDTVNGMPDSAMQNVLAGATTGLEGLNVVMGQLRIILDDVAKGQGTVGHLLKDEKLYKDLSSAITNIEDITMEMSQNKGALGKLIHDPALYNNLNDVARKTNELAGKLNEGSFIKLSENEAFYTDMSSLAQNLNGLSYDARSFMENLESGNIAKLSDDKQLYARIDRISTNLDSLLAKIDSGDGSAGKLLTDDELYDNMNKFFKDADALVIDLKENPDRYVNISVF